MITALTFLRACPTDIEPRCHVSIFIIDRLYILLRSFSLPKTLSIYFHTRSYLLLLLLLLLLFRQYDPEYTLFNVPWSEIEGGLIFSEPSVCVCATYSENTNTSTSESSVTNGGRGKSVITSALRERER